MARTGFRGIDIRQTSAGKLILRASLKDSSGAAVTAGSPTCRIVEVQDDGTFLTLEWNLTGQYTFKAIPITVTSPTSGGAVAGVVTHQALGIWTCCIPNTTNFVKGAIYIAIITGGTGAFPAQQEREFQWGDADGDLSVSAAKDAASFAVSGDAMNLTSAAQQGVTQFVSASIFGMPQQVVVTATGANSNIAGTYTYMGYCSATGRPVYQPANPLFQLSFDGSWELFDDATAHTWRGSSGFPSGTYHAVSESGATGTATVTAVMAVDPTATLAAIQAKTDLISSGSVRVICPLTDNGTQLTLVAGDDYFHLHGRAIDFISADYPDLSGATCELRILSRDTGSLVFAVAGQIVDAQTLRYEIPRAKTALLTPANLGTYVFASRVVFADGQIATEKRGQVLVLNG